MKRQSVNDAFERIGGISVRADEILHIENPNHYRNKAQIPVGIDEKGNLNIGFYSKHSHRIINSDGCLLQMEQFHSIVSVIRRYIL